MKTVSVIMPIYQAEEFLSGSLEGLAAQTLQNMEFVLVDDCSDDSSYDIAAAFQKKHSEQTILVRTEKRSGPGGARNLGISQATGEYIGFVDADDEIVPHMFQRLYEQARECQADIVDSGYYNEKLDYAMLHVSDELTGQQDSYKRSQMIVSGGYIVSKIFRRSFLEKWGLRFRENVSMEDSDFITRAFATADKVSNVKEILYKYTFTDYSASRERDEWKYYSNVMEAMNANYQCVCELPWYPGIQIAVEYLIIQLYDYGVVKCLSICNEDNRERVLHALREIGEMKKRIVKHSYDENSYVLEKINRDDIEIMKRNDIEPEWLVKMILRGGKE